MIIEYIGVKEINGSLIALDGVKDATFEETVSIRLDNGTDRDWGGQLGENYYSWPAHHYMNYELYEKDREKRL